MNFHAKMMHNQTFCPETLFSNNSISVNITIICHPPWNLKTNWQTLSIFRWFFVTISAIKFYTYSAWEYINILCVSVCVCVCVCVCLSLFLSLFLVKHTDFGVTLSVFELRFRHLLATGLYFGHTNWSVFQNSL